MYFPIRMLARNASLVLCVFTSFSKAGAMACVALERAVGEPQIHHARVCKVQTSPDPIFADSIVARKPAGLIIVTPKKVPLFLGTPK